MAGEISREKGKGVPVESSPLRFGPFEFDPAAGLLYRGEQEILLPPRAAGVLGAFLQRPGEILSKDELLGEVWKDAFVGEDSLTQAISMVRHALRDDPRDPTYIQTVPKRGYRFIAEVEGAGEARGGIDGLPAAATPPAGVLPATKGAATTGAAVEVGRTLGHYEILHELGAGATGRVFRARDTVLGREVAIKVLAEELVADAERLARLEREARLLASVSHPHIAAIYSLEEADGVKFPVLELVEGETLAERLQSRPLSVEEAPELARQIASALEAAHERGIVHRDLKPANIKLTPEGQVKVLDFGLAKALEVTLFGDVGVGAPTESMTIVGSRRGAIIGTAAYMSPEQARGQEADRRADIWAFGCVLYEMLTGRRAFGGETVSDTIAGLLEREPNLEALPPDTPSAAQRLLRRCLSKDPAHRLHDIADARIELEDAASAPEAGQAVASGVGTAPTPFWRTRRVWWGAAGVVAGAILTALLARGLWGPVVESSVPAVATASELVLPSGVSINPASGRLQLAISPNGERIVFQGRQDGVGRLYQRKLGEARATPLSGTDGGSQPFFSPDGESVGFFADGKLKKVRLDGGTPEVLCDAPSLWGATWGPDGTIVFNPDTLRGLWKVSENGGDPELVLPPDFRIGAAAYEKPTFLPDGKSVLMGIYLGGHGTFQLGILDLETGEHRALIDGPGYGVYVPSGHILFARPDGIYAVGFDPVAKTLTGPEVLVLRDVGFNVLTRVAQFAVSQTGTLVYMPGVGLPKRELVRVDLTGQVTPLPAEPRYYMYPRFSPDGTRIAVNIMESDADIWIVDVETGALSKLTLDGRREFPVWSPDGSYVAYTSLSSDLEGARWQVNRQPAARSGAEELLFATTAPDFGVLAPNQWSPDGRALVGQGFVELPDEPEPGFGIVYLTIDEPHQLETLIPASPGELMHGAAFSPESDWVVYVSDETESQQVYVTPFPGSGERWPISPGGGNKPLWSPDGKRIYYDTPGRMMMVDVTTKPQLRVSAPRPLLDSSGMVGGFFYSWPNFDLDPDGESFVMVRRVEGPPPPNHLSIVVNWLEKLNRLGAARP